MKKIDFARNDLDLYPILKLATKNELALLAEILANKLSSNIEKNERDPLKLAIELQSMGGDSIINTFRGKGVKYSEIANDVADKIGVKLNKKYELLQIEERIAEKLIEDYKKKLSKSELEEFERHIREVMDEQGNVVDAKRVAGRVIGGMTPVLVAVGSYIAKRGAIAAIPAVGQVFGAILAFGSALTAFTGTAYSVTVPSVLVIGSIRARVEAEIQMSGIEL